MSSINTNFGLKGYPKELEEDEWFIAKTTYGDKLVLKKSESFGTFITSSGTYIPYEHIESWLPFPINANNSEDIGTRVGLLEDKVSALGNALEKIKIKDGIYR